MSVDYGLQGHVAVITGSTSGIGQALARALAEQGVNVVLNGFGDPAQIEADRLAMQNATNAAVRYHGADMTKPSEITDLINYAVSEFGRLDILVNNASAISLTGTLETPMKKYDLMHQVNARGTFLCAQACLPHLLKSENPHVLTLSPPLNVEARWFENHVAYSMAKFGMSLCTLGMSAEFKGKVAFNALWPKTIIATAAIEFAIGNAQMLQLARKPSIMADAAAAILQRDAKSVSGHFYIDEEVLAEEGVSDFSSYRVNPNTPENQLIPDFFI